MTAALLRALLCALLLGQAVNAGASELPFRQPRAGLYTHGQPSEAQLQQAAAAGITTLIDLRAAGEDRGFDELATAERLGLRYVRLPIADGQALNADNARALHRILQQSDGPVLLHCASANRAGGLLALAAANHEGVTATEALAQGKAAGLGSLAPRVQQQLGLPAAEARTAPTP